MAPKKALVNMPSTVVKESLEGLVQVVPHLRHLEGWPELKVIVDVDHDSSKVSVVCGGGSGHEPSQAGFVGRGMLAATVCGEVFASPSAEAVLAAVHAVSGPAGCCMIVTNYTGDRLNFGQAVEQARAAGIPVEMVLVGEDCAIDEPGLVGRRGLVGTALVHKIAGAAADAGMSLEQVAAVARSAAASMGTLGVALSVCSVPGAPPSTRLGPEDIEVGLGVHGEAGYETGKWQPNHELVPRMLRRILAYKAAGCDGNGGGPGSLLTSGRPLALLVNNLGGTSNLELFAVVNEALGWLREQGHDVQRVIVGALMTSLDMAGISLTLMSCDEQRLALLDAPTAAPGWPAFYSTPSSTKAPVPLPAAVLELRRQRQQLLQGQPLASVSAEGRTAEAAVRAAAVALQAAAAHLNALDSRCGDGDTGDTCASAAQGLKIAAEGAFSGSPVDTLQAVAAVVRGAVGGSLGGFYHLGLTAAAAAIPKCTPSCPETWAAAMAAGVKAVQDYGCAQPGSRTMVDALLPAAEALAQAAAAGSSSAEAARATAAAAARGADATMGMVAKVGRASYLRAADAFSDADPGAVAVATWLGAMADAIQS